MKLFNYLKQLLENPKTLFFYSLFSLMLPSFFLLCTETMMLPVRIAFILIPLSLYAIVYSVFRKIGVLTLAMLPFMVLGAFQLVLLYLFGESIIAVDMFLNLFTTNASEAGELLANLWPAVVFVCVVYIPMIALGIVGVVKHLSLSVRFRKMIFGCGFVALLAGLGSAQFAKEFSPKLDIYPINVLYNIYFTKVKWQRSLNYPQTSEGFEFEAKRTKKVGEREVYFLIIGEASRTTNWSMFGYDRDTNPRLSQMPNLVKFRDAITQANVTHKSVPMILSDASATNHNALYKHKSVIKAFSEAGFKTAFISNQVPNRSFIDYFSGQADTLITMLGDAQITSDSKPDGVLLPVVDSLLKSTTEDMFIVLHTYGSHYDYRYRYPADSAYWTPDYVPTISYKYKEELVNSYDNSVRYTDYFLSQLMNEINKNSTYSALLYISDHGEDLMDDDRKLFLHASPKTTYYQLHVPCLVWFSEDYMRTNPTTMQEAVKNENKPVSTNMVFHTLLDMANIETSYKDTTYSIISDGFKVHPRYYLNDHDKAIEINDLGLKREDVLMFEKMHMQY